MVLDEREKMVLELLEILRTRRRSLRDNGGSTLTPPDASENILESAREDEKEKLVQELIEKLGKRRNLRESGGRSPTSSPHDDNVVSDMLEKILKSAKEEDKPEPYTVDWTLLEALPIKFREIEEAFSCEALTHDVNSCMGGSLNHGAKSTYIPSMLPDTKMAIRSPKRGPKSTDKGLVLPDKKKDER